MDETLERKREFRNGTPSFFVLIINKFVSGSFLFSRLCVNSHIRDTDLIAKVCVQRNLKTRKRSQSVFQGFCRPGKSCAG